MARIALGLVLSLIGAAAGTAIGLLVFRWAYDQNLYAMIVPGASLGLGVHLASLDRSKIRGAVFAIAALILGLVVEWWYFPFLADESFTYFLRHTAKILPVHLLMIALGGLFGYWWGKEASPWARKRPQARQGVEPR